MTKSSPSGPCSGLRVIEVTQMVAGPMAGQMLGDLGAEVIKIEALSGDPLRRVRPAYKGMSAHFTAMNRHKKSIFLDLKSPKGQEIAGRLVDTADVFLANTRPGVMDRLGLDYPTLSARNPKLIYALVTGFGESGPYAPLPAYDQVLQAVTGVLHIQALGGDPLPLRTMLVDKYTAAAAASAITAALLYRERNGGEGQKVSINLLDAFSSLLLTDATNYVFLDSEEFIPPYDFTVPIRTADGFLMGHIQTDEQFLTLVRAIDREELITDPRFENSWQRMLNLGLLWREVEKVTQTRGTTEWMDVFRSHALPIGPVNSIEQFFDDPQAAHNEAFVDFDDPAYGKIRAMNYPARLEKSPADVRARAPEPGEHSDAILEGIGFSRGEIDELKQEKIVA